MMGHATRDAGSGERAARTAPASPRSVTRGESPPDIAVGVDWLSFTFRPASEQTEAWRRDLCVHLAAYFDCEGWEVKRGWQGYECSARVGAALVAWGGEGQRGSVHVEVPGAACGGAVAWSDVAAWLERLEARITRVDLCADDYFGDRLSVDWGLTQFAGEGFTGNGRKPVARLVDDLGSGEGRTLYVGKRENGKLARVYEKGRQLGDKVSQWCRFEVEWRSKDRVLPYEMLTRPLEYLCGAYPCIAFLSSVATRIRTFKEKAVLSYSKMVSIARLHVGRAVNAMLHVTGGDIGAVVTLLRRSGLPKRLDAPLLAALTSG